MSSSSSSSPCSHRTILLTPSPHASLCNYTRPPPQKRVAATKSSGRTKTWTPTDEETEENLSSTFPGPLILPDDDLANDPKAPPQSYLSWKREKERNEVTEERRSIYVCGPPEMGGLESVRFWGDAVGVEREVDVQVKVEKPSTQDVIEYLAAFYHGMPVKPLPSPFAFGPWGLNPKASQQPKNIALKRKNTTTAIRTRACPDGLSQRQLNLNDILDACIDNLPKDAYSLLLLVEQDMYEDDDDDFCYGRTYGGSRVAVVSMARYNPRLDEAQDVERAHAWPGSHCERYVEGVLAGFDSGEKKSKLTVEGRVKGKAPHPTTQQQQQQQQDDSSPMRLAINAHTSLSFDPPSSTALTNLWLSRICKTSSHELGHCLGLDHCIYYACIMQSTASLAEDARQPPYLCPVDLAKMLGATGTGEKERHERLLKYCRGKSEVQFFVAFAAWLEGRSRGLEGKADDV
ncbi:hypothetical protein EJ08DRAFT_589402 [Tothia fuscella]|uniref:Uncharacterized protein n=1 Tax=Tothia fuscella TaxID=1048955 RepID=A0A9P4NS46_9PEZI|nr:hypothetical protein EJ08DRAFT_589402 [Tothia fuscella]